MSVCLHLIGIAPGKPILNLNVALCPSEPREPFPEHCHAPLRYWIVLRECVQADPPRPVRLLRPYRERPRRAPDPTMNSRHLMCNPQGPKLAHRESNFTTPRWSGL
jgi:hypothetical protein